MSLNTQGNVYALRMDGWGLIKIGFTTGHVHVRVKQLQQGSPHDLKWIGVWPGTIQDETAAHRALRPHRHKGEWFYPTPEVLAYVTEHSPAFCVDEYLGRMFHHEHLSVIKSVKDRIQYGGIHMIAHAMGMNRWELHQWLRGTRPIAHEISGRGADVARKILSGEIPTSKRPPSTPVRRSSPSREPERAAS